MMLMLLELCWLIGLIGRDASTEQSALVEGSCHGQLTMLRVIRRGDHVAEVVELLLLLLLRRGAIGVVAVDGR